MRSSTVTEGGAGRVRLLKLDCEGAEWPILLTSQRLRLVNESPVSSTRWAARILEISEERPARPPVFPFDNIEGSPSTAGRPPHRRRLHRHLAPPPRPNGAPEGLGLFFATREHGRKRPVPAGLASATSDLGCIGRA